MLRSTNVNVRYFSAYSLCCSYTRLPRRDMVFVGGGLFGARTDERVEERIGDAGLDRAFGWAARCELWQPLVHARISDTAKYTGDGYYARCLRCLTIGPERPVKEAARRALLVLGAREAADLQG